MVQLQVEEYLLMISVLTCLICLEYLLPFDTLSCPCIQAKIKQDLLLRMLNFLVFEFKLNKCH